MATSSSAMFDPVRADYDKQASLYNVLLKWPFGILESQLFASAIKTDNICNGASVLDLGGGTGLRARQALEAGAARVDVVDISHEMMQVGKMDAQALLGPGESERLRWFHGDVSKALFGDDGVRGLSPPYDIVLGN